MQVPWFQLTDAQKKKPFIILSKLLNCFIKNWILTGTLSQLENKDTPYSFATKFPVSLRYTVNYKSQVAVNAVSH